LRLTPEDPEFRGTVDRFEPVSMRCWAVDLEEFAPGALLEVEVKAPPRAFELADLRAAVTSPRIQTYGTRLKVDPNDGWQSMTWTLPVGQDESQHVLLTNVAGDAAQSALMLNLPITFRAVTTPHEYASIGKTTVNLTALADAINAPLELELRTPNVTMMRGRTEQSGEVYVGTGDFVGIENPCFLQFFASSESVPGSHFRNGLIFALKSSGALVTNHAYPIQSSFEFNKVSDYHPNVVAASAAIHEANGDILDYDFINGEVIFDTIIGAYIQGRLIGDGVFRRYSQQTQQYEVERVQMIAAKFGASVKAPMGRYKNEPYTCLSAG
jgi:hypothetical protein